MKNTLLLGAMLLATASLFTSCSDDNDSNPTLIQPTEFVLNTPTYAKNTVSLESTTNVPLTWSQPKYTADNAPINATYEVQLSLTNNFTVSKAQADADESGATVADYVTLDKTFTTCKAEVLSADIDKALNQLGNWSTMDKVPSYASVYFRVQAYVLEGTTKLNPITSNVVELSMVPYYIELKDAEPIMWYLVGNNILDGAWSDKPGTSSMPMFIIPGGTYDKTTGTGDIEYINYFTTEGWKIQPADFNWDLGFMSGGSANTATFRDGAGDAGNIWCDPAGIYKVTVNTGTNSCTIEKQDDASATYTNISLIGLNGDWNNDIDMTPANKTGENHVWVATVSVDAQTVFKFRANHDWGTNWGYGATEGEVNTMGKCSNGGQNIGIEAGKWLIIFNDINGMFNVRAAN